ncbi:hypothetical protein TWF730_000052 [Orbilia blumenaviensis]|uniref:DUF7779 domain-containing protein n=1 Tax=Orbilia blumenaviensis TaxID=1796055 RepID=A0AAV9VMK1_9PEZI
MAQVRRQGVTLLSAGDGTSQDAHVPNIIFVHGLRGHPKTTWSHPRSTSTTSRNGETDASTKRKPNKLRSFFSPKKDEKRENGKVQTSTSTPSDIFWPEEYLVPDLPDALIWTYGYNADVIGGIFQANNQNSVSQHGRDFAVKLEREINNEGPIVFVAHSLGGVIVKDALHRSEIICKRTKFIIFLGTPHRGSAFADWAQIASNLARLVLQDSNKRIIQALEVNGEVLDNIHEQFKTILHENRAIKVHSFQEAMAVSGIKGLHDKVVNDFSSKLDLSREQETVESIDANHMEMARCSSKDDERYRQIHGVLKRFLRTGLLKSDTNLVDASPTRPADADLANEASHTTRLVDTTDTSSSKRPFMVPFPQDDKFIGREDILDKLDLGDRQTAPIKHRRDALVGLGGVGKSQIAIEYAYRVRDHSPQTAVFWIHASTKARFGQAYQEMAEKLKIPGRSDPKVNILPLVYDWLSGEASGRWLIILDNVDDGNVFLEKNDDAEAVSSQDQAVSSQPPLANFLPHSPNGSILITSRNSLAAKNLVDTFGESIQVEPMEEADSLEMFKTKISGDVSSESDLKELVHLLEGIPLAITHAAAYIRSKPRVTVSTYLRLFKESENNQVRLLDCNEMKDLRRDHSIRHAVAKTWQISFHQIKEMKTEAADMLALMSMFNRQGIPEKLLIKDMDQLQFEDAISPLLNFSLIREQAGGSMFEMHRLVQLSTKTWLEQNQTLQKWQSEATEIIASLFPKGNYETWSECQVQLPHASEIMLFGLTDSQDLLNLASLKSKLGCFYMEKGNSRTAETMLREAVMIREESLGANHLDTLNSVSNLGLVLRTQGEYKKAELLHRRALKGKERQLGTDHLSTLISVDNLGLVLKRQGKYEEAELLHRRALKGKERQLGTDHPDTLISVNNLGLVLEKQGKYEEAELLHRRALKRKERQLGTDHPDTLISVGNLGLVLKKQGKYEEAELLHRRALKGKERQLGTDHPDTLISVINLGLVLEKQGKYEEAELLHRRALEGRKKVLGNNHPFTLGSARTLAYLLQKQGKYEEAESLFREHSTG